MKLERCITGTASEIAAAQAAADKLLGYPKKGTHIGGGIHVPMPDTWDGTGPTPPGWLKTVADPITATDGTVYLAITGSEAALSDPTQLNKLTGQERAALNKVNQAQLVDLKAIAYAAMAAAQSVGK